MRRPEARVNMQVGIESRGAGIKQPSLAGMGGFPVCWRTKSEDWHLQDINGTCLEACANGNEALQQGTIIENNSHTENLRDAC